MRKMSKLERTDLLRRLIDWIIACDLPFNTVSHPAFHHFVKGLNYGFKVPSRQLVGGKLLDEAVERCNEAILELCEGFEFGVTIHDGWTDTELYPIINAMVTLISTKRGKSDTVHALSDLCCRWFGKQQNEVDSSKHSRRYRCQTCWSSSRVLYHRA